MAASYVLSLVLVGLFSAAIANPQPDTTSTTTTTTASSAANIILHNLTEDEKAKICNVSMVRGSGSSSMTTTQTPGNPALSLRINVGPGDPLCCAYAEAVNGNNARCVSYNVCSFNVNETEPITTTTASPGTSTTMYPTTTVDPTRPTTTQPPPIPASKNIVYISLAPVPQDLTVIKQCQNSTTAIIGPSSSVSTNDKGFDHHRDHH